MATFSLVKIRFSKCCLRRNRGATLSVVRSVIKGIADGKPWGGCYASSYATVALLERGAREDRS
jgi:hypothetical protein